MHISSVIKISFCRISFSGHQNKFCACLDRYGSRVILVMCKNYSDISWHRLNLNQSKTNCPKNLNSDGLIVKEMGPWPECIFRSLLQFLVNYFVCIAGEYHITMFKNGRSVPMHVLQLAGRIDHGGECSILQSGRMIQYWAGRTRHIKGHKGQQIQRRPTCPS